MFLRFLKIAKIGKIKQNFTKLCLNLIEPLVHKSKQLQVVGLINLLVALMLTTHILACVWIAVGEEGKGDEKLSWIH